MPRRNDAATMKCLLFLALITTSLLSQEPKHIRALDVPEAKASVLHLFDSEKW